MLGSSRLGPFGFSGSFFTGSAPVGAAAASGEGA
jgi:hypothetical protein